MVSLAVMTDQIKVVLCSRSVLILEGGFHVFFKVGACAHHAPADGGHTVTHHTVNRLGEMVGQPLRELVSASSP